jgi:hypothetical protein
MLLNADIKVMARIIANRLGLWLPSIIHTSQHCGVRGHTIFDAVATVREAIAQAAHTKQALCILSLDFQAAFDNISHQYLFEILERYGFGASFQRRIRNTWCGRKVMRLAGDQALHALGCCTTTTPHVTRQSPSMNFWQKKAFLLFLSPLFAGSQSLFILPAQKPLKRAPF